MKKTLPLLITSFFLVSCFFNRGSVQDISKKIDLGQYKLAKKDLLESLKYDGDEVQKNILLLDLSKALFVRQRDAKSAHELVKAYSLRPMSDVSLQQGLEFKFLLESKHLDQPDEALTTLEQLQKLPNFDENKFAAQKLSLMYRADRFVEVVLLTETLEDEEGLLYRAMSFEGLSKNEQALATYDKILEGKRGGRPSSVYSLSCYKKALLHERLKQYRKAQKALNCIHDDSELVQRKKELLKRLSIIKKRKL